jgi:hypothetical protein
MNGVLERAGCHARATYCKSEVGRFALHLVDKHSDIYFRCSTILSSVAMMATGARLLALPVLNEAATSFTVAVMGDKQGFMDAVSILNSFFYTRRNNHIYPKWLGSPDAVVIKLIPIPP